MLQTICCHVLVAAFALCVWMSIPNFLLNTCIWGLALVSGLYLCFITGSFVDRLIPRRKVSTIDKAVLITGCDRGFGHQLAKRLDTKGLRVFAGCLYPSGPGAQSLKSSTSKRFKIVEIDVTKDESVQQALNVVKEELGTSVLWAVVNNAGIMFRGELEWTPLEEQVRIFDVNTFGVIRVTQAFLPLLRKFKGRVVTITSVGGRFTPFGFVPYCMTKHATYSFCNGLRQEMKKWGIKVITVEPFSYNTAMCSTEGIFQSSDAIWSKVPASLKEEYGPHYIDAFKETLKTLKDLSVIKDTKNVIDSLEEAVIAENPHYSYVPGDVQSHIGFQVLQHAPTGLVNAVLERLYKFHRDMAERIQAEKQHNDEDKKCT